MMIIRKPILLSLVLFSIAAAPLSSQAGIKCWTNKDGVRECGNAVPPEYAQQESRTINERGITTDVQKRAKTKQELEAEQARRDEEERKKAEAERLRAEEAQRQKEQAAYDRVLLATFLTEEDIIRSRDRKLSAIDGTIELARITRDKVKEKLEKEQAIAQRHTKKDKPVPEAVQKDIDSLSKQLESKESYIASKLREREELTEKYEKDLERFRELKSGE